MAEYVYNVGASLVCAHGRATCGQQVPSADMYLTMYALGQPGLPEKRRVLSPETMSAVYRVRSTDSIHDRRGTATRCAMSGRRTGLRYHVRIRLGGRTPSRI